jgi:hypothetical protein
MRNSSGTTITTRRIQITAGFAVRFFTNTMGFLIEAIQADPASSETLQGHMLDQSPNLQSDVSNYVIMAGRRNNTSVDDGSGNIVGHYAAIDNGTPAFVAGRLPSTLNAASGAIALQNIQSSFLLRDFLIHINQAGTIRWSGRICHALEIDSTIPPGSDRAVKIDTSTTATYRVTGNPLIQTARMCMRKS